MKPDRRLVLTIRQRLALYACALLLSVILVFGFISYIGVRKAALQVGENRLQSLTEQLSTMLSGNTRTFITTSFAYANKPAIKSFLLSNGKDSANEATKLIEDIRKDTTYVQVELKNADRALLLKNGADIKIDIDPLLKAKIDSGKVGKLYIADSSVYYPLIATVVDNHKPIGYVIRWKKMIATAKSLEQLSQLLGTDARLLVGNAGGDVWTDMRVAIPAPPINNKSGIAEYSDNNKKVLAYVRPIANSQWVVAIELSKNKILEAAHTFLYWLIIAGLIILTIGITIAWLMSRKLSEPLRKLTAATTAIASGNHSTPVQVNRHDELGKLARAFNAMQVQVQQSQEALVAKAEKYKLLFEDNPMPMWIINKATFDVIDVNKAAVQHYGYSKEEFLQLNEIDLRPAEDIDKWLTWTRSKKEDRFMVWRHKKKDDSIIHVEVITDDMVYQDQEARLVLTNDITEKLKAEAELLKNRIEQQRIITETTIQVQEKEREEIGRELHDNINQILAAAKMHNEIGLRKNQSMEPFIKSGQNIALAIQEIRELSQNLVAPSLADITLCDAIQEVADNMNKASTVNVEMRVKNYSEEKLDDTIKLMFYRIVQEQTHNILKHAEAKHVVIELSMSEENTLLTVADDGKGFDITKTSKGIGLKNIVSRAKFYNGSALIHSSLGKGSRLEVKIPWGRERVA